MMESNNLTVYFRVYRYRHEKRSVVLGRRIERNVEFMPVVRRRGKKHCFLVNAFYFCLISTRVVVGPMHRPIDPSQSSYLETEEQKIQE